jgi:hypothetical protein
MLTDEVLAGVVPTRMLAAGIGTEVRPSPHQKLVAPEASLTLTESPPIPVLGLTASVGAAGNGLL